MIPWSGKTVNVTEFIKVLTGVNYLSKFHFEIFDYDNNLIDANQNLKNKLARIFFYSENITIPSRGLNTEAYTYANGFRFEVPTGTNYGDGNIDVSMHVDKEYQLYDFFIKWMNKIHSKETGFFSFHEKYISKIKIKQLDNTASMGGTLDEFLNFVNEGKGKYVFGIELINCYPKAVGAISFRHDSKDMVKFNVNFSYEKIRYFSNKDEEYPKSVI